MIEKRLENNEKSRGGDSLIRNCRKVTETCVGLGWFLSLFIALLTGVGTITALFADNRSNKLKRQRFEERRNQR